MTGLEFENVVRSQFKVCSDTLLRKKEEYCATDDRLDQFKKIAALRGSCPEEVLAGMMVKHTSSVYDCVDTISKGGEVAFSRWVEKITDHINYLLLLKALIVEQKD